MTETSLAMAASDTANTCSVVPSSFKKDKVAKPSSMTQGTPRVYVAVACVAESTTTESA